MNSPDATTPLLLLPVNIETRFVDRPDGPELWVRIYPDQISINSHEPELTTQEQNDGAAYWQAVWRAGNPPASPENAKAPWRCLAGRYGPERAAWIALQMTPANLAQMPPLPTPDGTGPVPAPLPPSPPPPTRDSSWEKPPVANALPDKWIAVAVSGTQRAQGVGNPISAELHVGMDPGAGAFPKGSPVDAGIQWLIEFDEAFTKGMAVKIRLNPEQRRSGFDRVFVYGIHTQGSGSDDLAALLDAHHYTDGFSFLCQGAPTHNTADADSAYSRKDTDYEISFCVERALRKMQGLENCKLRTLPSTACPDSKVQAKEDTDWFRFATLLGIDPCYLAHVRYADGTGVRNGTDMLTALWDATLGYFLGQIMADQFLPDQIDSARQYILAYANTRGPIPPFRVATTPYGVLPITSLRLYKPVEGESLEAALVTFLLRVWPTWLASAANAPHLDRNSSDPDKDLLGVLGMDARSTTFRGREIFGMDFLWNHMSFLGMPFSGREAWLKDNLASGVQLLHNYGYGQLDPRVVHLGKGEASFPISLPTVQDGPLSESDPLRADPTLGQNYVQWLQTAPIDDIRAEKFADPQSLLYKILRQSVLQAYAGLAANAELNAKNLQQSQLREQEFVGFPTRARNAPNAEGLPALSVWDVLARPALPNPKFIWAEYFFQPEAETTYPRLAELRASLGKLANLPTAELDRLLTEVLDASSHRLDVYATAIATAILHRTRIKNPGVHLGGFGWAEEVRPGVKRKPIRGPELSRVSDLDQLWSKIVQPAATPPVPLEPMVDNGGFVLAPSSAQAAVAAVLRCGFMTRKGSSDGGLLTVDLSSERVRKALLLLDGVRQGQSLGTLLGYIFESGLHDKQLDKYTQPFRELFPITANKLTSPSARTEFVAASNVVDGKNLRTAWQNGRFVPGEDWGTNLPGSGQTSDQDSIIGILEAIDDYADALGDLTVAEAVFQAIRGNFGRAGSLMDAVSKGATSPDPEVIKAQRGGVDVTHRVSLLAAGRPSGNSQWMAERPRAAAEPWFTSWISMLLPSPDTVVCNVNYHDTRDGADHTKTVRLSDLDRIASSGGGSGLGISPLDCLALADAEIARPDASAKPAAASIAETPQQSELEQRILYNASLPATAQNVQIDYKAPDGSFSFADFFFLCKSLRKLFRAARPLTPPDLTLAERVSAKANNSYLLDFRKRASDALQRLNTDIASLQGTDLRDAVVNNSFYGVVGAIPKPGEDDTAIAARARSVLDILQDRSTKAQALLANIDSSDATKIRVDDVRTVFETIFGKDFIALPQFALSDPDLVASFDPSSGLAATDLAALSAWLMQLSHIRPAIGWLDTALTLAQVLSGSAVTLPNLRLAQLPLPANNNGPDRWLGLPNDPNAQLPPAKGRTAFECFTYGTPTSQSTYAGLLVDEWHERIPSPQESAAVTFHYEEPRARAPQTLLLAVCPDGRAEWNDELVLAILEEALEIAKIRTVDLDSLQQFGQVLPALYFPFNIQNATSSTNFVLKESH